MFEAGDAVLIMFFQSLDCVESPLYSIVLNNSPGVLIIASRFDHIC